MEMRSDRINSLTGMRVIAMLTIFCSHLYCLNETPFHGFYHLIDNGRLGVNFFLVLSGYVLALGYGNKLNVNSMSQDFHFIKRRLSKIYVPYIITMMLAIPLYILNVTAGENPLNVKLLIVRLLINTGLIQSAIPFARYSASINEVSWFISTIFIIYLFTPGILRLNHKAAKHYTLSKLALLVFFVLFLYCGCYMAIREIEYIHFPGSGLSIIYINPVIRLFPFLLGIIGYNICCLLGHFRIKNGSLVEMLGMAVFFVWWLIANKTGLPTVVTECTDMLVSMLVILIFSVSKKGMVSGLLSKEKMLNWGKISLEFYLIHYLVINYGMIAAKRLNLDKGITVFPLPILFLVLSLYGAYLIHSVNININKS